MKKTIARLKKRPLPLALVIIASVVFALTIWHLRQFLLLLLGAYLMMATLQPIVEWVITLTHLPRPAAVSLTYLACGWLIATIFSLLVPFFLRDNLSLISSLHLERLMPGLQTELTLWFDWLTNQAPQWSRFSTSFHSLLIRFSSTIQIILYLLTGLITAIYLSLEHDELYKRFYWFTDDEGLIARAQEFFRHTEQALSHWCIGQICNSIIITIFIFVLAFILNLPLPLWQALLCGAVSFVPRIGLILATLIGSLLSWSLAGAWSGGLALVMYLIVNQFDLLFLQNHLANIHSHVGPLLTLLLLFAGWQLAGTLGLLLAVPLYILLREVYHFWLQPNVRLKLSKMTLLHFSKK